MLILLLRCLREGMLELADQPGEQRCLMLGEVVQLEEETRILHGVARLVKELKTGAVVVLEEAM